MSELDVYLEQELAGTLSHNPVSNQFAFSYSAQWLDNPRRYPLSPHLPLEVTGGATAEVHSSAVRNFFDNLLPEGRALDEAAAANKVSKSNLVGLMVALGRETAGALSLRLRHGKGKVAGFSPIVDVRRPLSKAELSERIRARPREPFSVWDGKVRMSIAGYQDKIAIFEDKGEWFLIDSAQVASTLILKPEPLSGVMAGLTSNEFFCMLLAKAAGLPTADVRLLHVPEPVLAISRFDRIKVQDTVRRLHVIDGCQALGISSMLKYERPYGDNADAARYRIGASLPQLFRMLQSFPDPAAQRLQLLRWAIFQVLIGNTDAHAKNVSFFNDDNGMRLAPTYDLICTLAFVGGNVDHTFAMAIGDAFTEPHMTPYQWAHLGHLVQLQPRLIANELRRMATRLQDTLRDTMQRSIDQGADVATVDRICAVVERIITQHLKIAKEVAVIEPGLFA
jgi:serine/threonine-protein kinase HipA